MSVTIYGCYKKKLLPISRERGEIEFSSRACKWRACHITSDGLIALTLDYDWCDDTYYGCYDNVTGKFEIVLPNSCCPSCAFCIGMGYGLVGIQLTFSNIVDCPCDTCGHYYTTSLADELNNTFVLDRVSNCVFGKCFSSNAAYFRCPEGGRQNSCFDSFYIKYELRLWFGAWTIWITIDLAGRGFWWNPQTGEPIGCAEPPNDTCDDFNYGNIFQILASPYPRSGDTKCVDTGANRGNDNYWAGFRPISDSGEVQVEGIYAE